MSDNPAWLQKDEVDDCGETDWSFYTDSNTLQNIHCNEFRKNCSPGILIGKNKLIRKDQKSQSFFKLRKQNTLKWNFFLDFILYDCLCLMKFQARCPCLKQKTSVRAIA